MMRDTRDIKISEVLEELHALKEQNEFLQTKNEALQKECKSKAKCIRYLSGENLQKKAELRHIKNMSMFEFGNTYCNDKSLEEDARALAHSLGVGK